MLHKPYLGKDSMWQFSNTNATQYYSAEHTTLTQAVKTIKTSGRDREIRSEQHESHSCEKGLTVH